MIPGLDLQGMRRLRREVHIMPEWIPVILSVCFAVVAYAACPFSYCLSHSRDSAACVLGSCREREWYIMRTYFLIDLAQTVLGFAAGAIAAHFMVHRARGDGANCVSVAPAHSRNRYAWKCAAADGFQELGLPARSNRKRF